MFFKGLEGFLQAQTAELSQKLTELIGDIVPVYNTEADEDMDASLKDAYSHISSIVDSWMKLVLQMNALESNSDEVSASLITPCGTRDYSVSRCIWGVHTLDNCSDNLFEESIPWAKRSMFHTPIGDIDYFTYRCICDIVGNPVQIFYKWVKQQCDLAHILITLSPEGYVPQEIRDRFDAGEGLINWDDSEAEGFADDILNDSILSLAGINDPLNLCRLDTCVSHIDEFFDSFGYHERGVVL